MWQLNWTDWLDLFVHFMGLSLIAVGGAITTMGDIHRYVVLDKGWLSDETFSASVAIAQAAPGPNASAIAVIGFNVGMASAGWWGAIAAMCATFIGVLLPSSILTLTITRWMYNNKYRLGVQAFKAGMVPVTLSLLIATGWILSAAGKGFSDYAQMWPFWALTFVGGILVWRTKIHLLWLLAIGASVGIGISAI